MSNVKLEFDKNSVKVLGSISDAVNVWLEEALGEVEAKCKRTQAVGKVNGGNTKQSWKHKVDKINHMGLVGNTEETAIWNELGTGDYALNGDGRKGGWYIPIGEDDGMISQAVVDAYGFKVVYGKNGMRYAFTTGMKPKRTLHNAVESSKGYIEKSLKAKLKELGK